MDTDPIDAELFELIDDYRASQCALPRYPSPRRAFSGAAGVVLTPEEQELYRACFPDEEEI